MSRVKGGVTALKRRKKILKLAKGYRNKRSTKEREAKIAVVKAGVYAFAHRRKKKGDFRRNWSVNLSAGLKEFGISYSKFIDTLKKKNILVNRKMMASMAEENPESFKRFVEGVK